VAAVASVIAAVATSGRPQRALLPLVFLAVVGLIAARGGALAGVLAALISAAVFAWFDAPAGSLRVTDPEIRGNLAWLLLGGIVISHFVAARPHPKN
jgi:K+-sensing histidine kinase KdpD